MRNHKIAKESLLTLRVCVLLEIGNEFDWAAYLREGIEYQTYSDSGSEVCMYTCVAVDNSN